MTLYEFFEKPSVRYPLLSFVAAFALSTSLTALPLVAACGASLGVSILVSMGVRISLYLKSIGDEAKSTLNELHETFTEVKKTIANTEKNMENLNLTLQDFSKTAKALEKTLAIDPKISKHTLAESLTETLVELKATAKTLNDNLAFDKEKGEKPLGEQLKATLATVNKTAAEVTDTVENGRQGLIGRVLGAAKTKPAQKPAEKMATEKAPAEKAPLKPTEVEKTVADLAVEQTPGWISNPLTTAYWGFGKKSQTAKPSKEVDDKPVVKPALIPAAAKKVQTRSSSRRPAKQ